MDEIETLRQYAARSRAPADLNIDVTADVLNSLRRSDGREAADATLRPLLAAAAACCLLTLGVGFYVQQAWSEIHDPLNSLVTPFVVALQ